MTATGRSSHFSLKHGAVGRAGPHAAYVLGLGKYASREDVVFTASGDLPEFANADPLAFWEAADNHERANGRTYHEFEFAIPRELSPEQARTLVESWISEKLRGRHPWTYGIHSKIAADGLPNVHCHLMFSDRKLDGIERSSETFFKRAASRYRDRKTGEMRDGDPAKGGAGKERLWNDRKVIAQLRGEWATHVNSFLADHGHKPRIDMRSNLERGQGDAEPKVGPDRQRRGGDRYREIRRTKVAAIRHERRIERDEVQFLKRQLGAARRERARRDTPGCHPAEKTGQRRPFVRSPLGAMAAEPREGKTVFRWQHGVAAGRAALIDRGDAINLAGRPSTPKASAAVALAKAKGWTSLVLTGSGEFKRLAAVEAIRAGVTVANPELAGLVAEIKQKIEEEAMQQSNAQERDQSETLELARRWLATEATFGAIEAAELRRDPERLLKLVERHPEAQRFVFVERQRRQGVPIPLLGKRIERHANNLPNGAVCTVRHVGKQTWLEDLARPGVVVPIPLSTSVPRVGQQVTILRTEDGVEIIQPSREYTPRPR